MAVLHPTDQRTSTAALLTCIAALLACKASGTVSAGGSSSSSAALPPAPPPVFAVFRKAPPSRERIDLPFVKGQIVPARKWPDACTLLGKDDIEAILPGATRVDPWREPAVTRTIEDLAAGRAYKDEQFTPNGQCVYMFQLPSETAQLTRLWIRIRAVADPALIEKFFGNEVYLVTDIVSGINNCGSTSLYEGNLICHSGPLLFEVGGYGTARFKETAAFSSAPPFFWRDTILPAFANLVTAKVATPKKDP